MARPSAVEIVKMNFINELELANLLGVTKERVRDLRSKHKNNKGKFIDSYSPSANITYYKLEDVLAFIEGSKNDVYPVKSEKSETEK